MPAEPLFRVFLFLVFVCSAATFLKVVELMNHHEIQAMGEESIGNIALSSMKSAVIVPLEHEAMFENTLKKCMPTVGTDGQKRKNKKECKTFIPEGSNERIAILSPPGRLNKIVLEFIRIVLSNGEKGADGEIAATQVDVIPTTNMAPYGYGKTHGYTRIIRTVPQPLLLGATDTLIAALEFSSWHSAQLSFDDITLNDLKAALRQQVRYHCRLNHIAAHTALWTIGVEEFTEIGRGLLVQTAQDFFGLDSKQEDLLGRINAQYELLRPDGDDESKHGVIEEEDDDRALVELNSLHAEGSKLLNLILKKTKMHESNSKSKRHHLTNDVLKILDDVLLDEMRLSKNLTAWPCESFWTVGEPGSRLELSPIVQSISKAMSPNCSALYTSCFVEKDKCEARGDGKCK